MSSTLYDHDFYAWTNEQAGLLRSGKLSEADLEHIAEEIESMGKSEKRELISRLTVLLLHLLKWEFQPMRRGASWRLSIANTRDALADHLADNPSLRSVLEASVETAYRRARRDAALETGLSENTFPMICPWSFSQMMDENFWPEV
ncbi:hypothetical protein AA0312_1294 [Acetobacter tropicalis NRIC 0312]|uniref:DUF29 domain-containing protein n=1 Tax=Acetobacter tropicalis TaxID=104102 RepID=A0A511FSF2_9PROT|nr:DUF29 domain-containing protein [Acetobacter tropicalis]KXV51659.1 hypothetical protein AD944_01140 [Acetobacter tropicalis]GBR69219.1 hypothetical protein AA0312_1294 [Acetobacter tropicalis NRIC 0312]GEL51857.1 hypothetical protein ATR01nite_29320 [Acetobacter tropicalis]